MRYLISAWAVCIARSAKPGNAKASIRGTSRKHRFPRFFHILIKTRRRGESEAIAPLHMRTFGHTPISLTRTVQPVGQGLFCTEIFKSHDKAQVVVYDCGSQNTEARDTCISHAIPPGAAIDLVFLSHFDDDHINGLSALCGKFDKNTCLIVPQYRGLEWFFNLSCMLPPSGSRIRTGAGDIMARFTSIVKAHHIKVVEVSPTQTPSVGQGVNGIIALPTLRGQSELVSGTLISMPQFNGVNFWSYLPVNHYDTVKMGALKKDLDLTLIDGESFGAMDGMMMAKAFTNDAHLKQIKKIYGKYFKRNNEVSMMVVSSPMPSPECEIFIDTNPQSNCPACDSKCKHLHFVKAQTKAELQKAGCLYTGDADLTNKTRLQQLNALCPRIADIGLLQIPITALVAIWMWKPLPLSCHHKLGVLSVLG